MDLQVVPKLQRHPTPSCCHGGPLPQSAAEEQVQFRQLLCQSAVALIAGLLLMLLSFLNFFPAINLPLGQSTGILMGTIAFVVLAYSGHDVYAGAYRALKAGRANMDTLIALGTGAAWLLSMAVVIFPDHFPQQGRALYFESALIVLGFVKLGAALELKSRRKTRAVIERLKALQPKMARVWRHEEEIEIPVEEVLVGDMLTVRPGEQIPVDALITEGASAVDESMISGESLTVEKTVGAKVIGGTLNKNGSFKCLALHVGKDQALAQIVELVARVQNAKSPLTRLADRVASYFVPVVIVIALVSAFLWYYLGPQPQLTYMVLSFCSVLLIACPCALGLATPLAVMNGVSRAAESGILVRDGDAFNKIPQLTTIVLDKTGTITEGKPQLLNILPERNWTARQLLQMATSLENDSEHPLASAFLSAAGKEGLSFLPVERFTAIPGYGLSALIDGKSALLGNQRLMQEREIIFESQSEGDQALAKGQTILYLALDGKPAGRFIVADTVKADSKNAIAQFKAMGLKVIMLTGDQDRAAQAIAQEVGIEEVMSHVLPHEKLQKIVELKRKGEKVAMVGDGINDAPALAEADVGIAIGGGADVAIESGDLVLMNTSLLTVVRALDLSLATAWNIRENLFGAFIYNIVAIPVAAGLLYPFGKILISPMLAGVLMALSSLTVVLNASRLRFK